MKMNKLAIAIAASVAGQAYALDVATNTPDIDFSISGATAANKQVQTYFASLCDINTQTNYIMSDGNDDATAVFCNVPASAGLFATDKKIFFRKENGGSSTGVAPITTADTVNALDISTCVQNTAPAAGIAGEGTCSTTLVQIPAQVGISDVEPELFVIPDNGSKTVDLSAPLTVSPVNAQTFGVVVSPGLRDALQTAQGLTAGSDEVDQMPSLSSDMIANIFAGNVADWAELKGLGGAAIDASAGLSNGAVNTCVRTPGSGTQAQFNAYYMQNPCSYKGASDLGFVGFNTLQDDDGSQNEPYDTKGFELFPGGPIIANPGPHVHWAKGSSDMGKCVTQITADGRWAIGIQSLEKVDEGRTNRNDFKYLRIDGVAPTLENVASGLYQNWAALTIQWRNDVVTGDALTLANEFVAIARNVADVQAFNLSLQQDDGSTSNDDRPVGGFNTPEILDGGVAANVGTLAFASGTTQPSFPFAAGNPVMPFNKGLVGPSSCAVPTFSATGLDVTQTN